MLTEPTRSFAEHLLENPDEIRPLIEYLTEQGIPYNTFLSILEEPDIDINIPQNSIVKFGPSQFHQS